MKKRAADASLEVASASPSTHDYSVSERRLIGRVAMELRGEGRSWASVGEFLSRIAPGVPLETVRPWVRQMKAGHDPFADVKAGGRPEKLTDLHLRIVVGRILYLCDRSEIIKLRGAREFLFKSLGVSVVEETLRLRLPPMGIKVTKAKLKLKKQKTLAEKTSKLKEFVVMIRQMLKDGWEIISLDFTYSSHRTAAPTTLAPHGKPVNSVSKISRFTNTLMTGLCSWGDQIPSFCYTLNSEFRTDRKKTARREALESRLAEVLQRHQVTDERICYDGKDTGEKGTFRGEYAEMVTDFLENNRSFWEGRKILFLSDNGNAFKDGEESIIEKNGYGKHMFYPACVHQYLSPNDNNLHGVAKMKWRAEITDFSDDVEATVSLMAHLDAVSKEVIKGWFKRNFFIGAGKVRDEDIAMLIEGQKSKWSRLHEECLAVYQEWAGIEVEVTPEERRLSSGLDGSKWAGE
jgi:transposase